MYVHLGDKYKLINKLEENEYLLNGWKPGKGVTNSTKDTVYVNNGVKNKRISSIILEEFLLMNPEYKRGRLTTRVYDTGFKLLNKDGITKKFKKDQLEYAYSNGWK